MKAEAILQAFVPWYGAGARFRFFLRLREFYRKNHLTFLGQCLKNHMQYKYGCEISINASISPSVSFMHTVGVVIGEGVIIEPGVIIYGGVCLGRKDIHNEDDYPVIKRDVILCTNCTVLGKITVGVAAVIGAKSLVLTDCIPGGVYVGSPAHLVNRISGETKWNHDT